MNTPNVDLKELPRKALKQIRALAKGNGVEPDSIQIKSAGGEIIHCLAISHLELHPEIIHEKKKGRIEAGQLLQNPVMVEKAVHDFVTSSLKNDEVRKALANMLLSRPDKGFGMHAEYFELESLNRDFCSQQPCDSCQGIGNVNCSRCGGNRRETCPNCHGRTMVTCINCHGTGSTQGADGKQKQCTRCFGNRQTSCSLCQKTGNVACRQCKGSGTNQCNSCKGAAFFTHITHVHLKLKTLFEIDRAELPHPAVKIIEDAGWKMVERGHIKLTAEQVKKDDGGLAIQYDSYFPYGDLELNMNGKPLKTHLFGYKGKMLKLPHFLNHLIEQNYNLLVEAANNEGAVATKITKASKSRLLADALLLAVTLPPKRAMMGLKKKYPMGASNDLIKNAILMSNKAIANTTRKTRYVGLAVSAFLLSILDAAYFIGPLRPLIETSANNIAAIIADIILFIIGGFLANKMMAIMAKRPLQKALGSLFPAQKKAKAKIKAHKNIWIGFVTSAIIAIGVLIIAKFIGIVLPVWFIF